MTEPRTSSPGLAATREQAELLATKISIPPPRPDRLARSQLLQRLNEGMVRQLTLTLVCTPAGFGKTTLLADWATSTSWAVAWLSLDPDDNDPARFWRYVVAALDRAGAGIGEQLRPLLTAPTPLSGQGVATALISRLQAQSDEVALVLDDYHTIEEPAVHDGLAFLLRHLPPQLHLVISSRSDPPLPLARLRASGQLAELRAADLRFTGKEVATFLGEVWRLELSSGAVAALETRTEGWAAGLQLAALSLQGRSDPAAFLDAFTGSHRYVMDYLSEEVLERQPDRVRTFLLQTSVLERLSGPLGDAVTGGSDGQGMLEELERANLFLLPLDEERRWYRFHHLFADLLRARVVQLHSDLVPELHRRAATWYEQHGLTDEAIRHALACGDPPWATRLVKEHLGETIRRGEIANLQRRLSLLSNAAVRSRPGLCLAQGFIEIHHGHMQSAERLLQHAERNLDREGGQQTLDLPTGGGMVAEAPAAIALLRAELAGARGDAQGMARFATAALAHIMDDEHGPRFFARLLVAGADWMSGRLADAEAALVVMLAEARTTPVSHPAMMSLLPLGQVQQAQGKLGAALRTYREGLRLATMSGRSSAYHAGEAHLGIAQVLYARNQLDDALRHVTEAIDLGRQVEFQLLALGLTALSRIRQALGDPEAALNAIEEACQLLPATELANMFGLARLAQAERARLLLVLGRVEGAERWAEERGLTEQDEASYPRERDQLVLARLLLAQSQPDRALGLLERLDALAEAQDRTGSLIEIRALRSLALQAAGEHQEALSLLAEALTLAQPEGHVRVFADEGPSMAALLRSLVGARQRGRGAAGAGSGVATEHLRRVVQAFGPVGDPADKTAPAAGLIEPLTDRELEVLRLLAAGRRNRDIAAELVVTLETVKKHVSHIFDKLGAANRVQAVTHARRLGLIP
jgi:LuxR family transcriptional regulator, maltose regulon positive regulatory protein